MRSLAVFLDLAGRAALVVGDGPVIDRKAALLERAGAELRRTAGFDELLLEGCAVAIGADAPEPELEALSAAAQARGIPVNIVDRPALCSFIMPAIVDRSPVIVAIGTGGAAPVLARLVRTRIEAMLPPASRAGRGVGGRVQGGDAGALPGSLAAAAADRAGGRGARSGARAGR